MQARLAKISLFLACVGAFVVAPRVVAAPILSNGDEISTRFDYNGGTYAGPVLANVVIGGGPEVSSFPGPNGLQDSNGFKIDFEANTIKIDVVALYNFTPGAFNGIIFEPTNPALIPDFANVFISAGGLTGFDNSRISFTGDSISLNFSGLTFNPQNGSQSVTLQIEAAPTTEVPEPASLALWSASAIGLGALARWRRRREEMQSSAA
jgi:MYXO-CTERM domain-containing protein